VSLAQRSITSVSWNAAANLVQMVVGFARSVLLARLLPVEVFGIYALAGSVVALSGVLPNFGMAGAFVHRASETQDEAQTAAAHFTLKLIFTLLWAALLTGGAFLFTAGRTRVALLALIVIHSALQLAHTPKLILTRRVVHRRLALVQLLDVLLSTPVALGLAWQGVTLWALLATDVVRLIVNISALYVWRPVWRPRLAWSPPLLRYFLRFGSRNLVAFVLLRALDRVDDLWTGLYLGETPLSFYSRAYRFAPYPRAILAAPITTVAGGTYAELKGDRLRLSRAFFRVNAFLVRSGFFLAGLLALIAPEFIRLLLGVKWLPMLDAFRLMLVFTLLDPIKLTVAGLFVAVGKPDQLVRANAIQLVVMVAALSLLGPSFGIAGVALAVDMMLLIGIALLLWLAKAFVDISVQRLFTIPGLALVGGLVSGRAAIGLPGIMGSDWRTGLAKAAVFCVVYSLILLTWERRQAAEILSTLAKRLSSSVDQGCGSVNLDSWSGASKFFDPLRSAPGPESR